MSARVPASTAADEALYDDLQRRTFGYFLHEFNSITGLIADKTAPNWPASIAAVGLALSACPVGVERNLIQRAEAICRVETTLDFLWNAPQGEEPDASGYRGFFYHFLDMETGRRAWHCELSTVDTAFLIAGASGRGRLLRSAVRAGAPDPGPRASHLGARRLGVGPERRPDPDPRLEARERLPPLPLGRLRRSAPALHRSRLASPTHPIPAASYGAWASTYAWKSIYGQEYLYAGPLFIHQLSHVWIDFRKIQDAPMRERGIDYFENSRRATLVHQQYAIQNPLGHALYGEHCWGLTASDGPGETTLLVDGVERRYFDYVARGAPFGPDDGTIAPWSVVASLPFAPEIVLPTIRYFIETVHLTNHHPYGFKATFNPTYPVEHTGPYGWVSPWTYGLNQGPIVLMIENHRSGFFWDLMKRSPPIREGLSRAGFTGGWLSELDQP